MRTVILAIALLATALLPGCVTFPERPVVIQGCPELPRPHRPPEPPVLIWQWDEDTETAALPADQLRKLQLHRIAVAASADAAHDWIEACTSRQ